jgi:hypothetical protein
MLLSRKCGEGSYPESFINSKNRSIEKTTKDIKWQSCIDIYINPKLPSISNIITKHWKTPTTNSITKRVFSRPPRLLSISSRLVLCRANLPKQSSKKKGIGSQKVLQTLCSVFLCVEFERIQLKPDRYLVPDEMCI